MDAVRMNQCVEYCLQSDRVVNQDELVAILTEALQDDVQAYELDAAKGLLQQSQQILMQAQQNLAYAQANNNNGGMAMNGPPSVLGLVIGGVTIGANVVRIREAQHQYDLAAGRAQAYQVIYNELHAQAERTHWWMALWH